MYKFMWVAGLLTGTCWSLVNFWFLFSLLKIALTGQDKRKLCLILFLKFPVLYTAGFLILISGYFPLLSLLSGLGLGLLLAGATNIWNRRK